MAVDLLALAHDLARQGEPFVLATVVRCESPTSAKPGFKAIICTNGTLTGWVGGSCAQPVVVREALAALRDGQPRLVALIGEGGKSAGRTEGLVEYPMTCYSGGTLEVYIEPVLPKLQLVLVGSGPVAETLETLAKAMSFRLVSLSPENWAEQFSTLRITPRTFIVVSTHGACDEEALGQALRSDAGYISFVASRKRAGSILETLRARGVPAERFGRLRSPAGLDIGAVTPEEIAVSILAEIVQVSRKLPLEAKAPEPAVEAAVENEARDPVCGMVVEITTAKHRSVVSGREVYFCCSRCKEAFDREPARYVTNLVG